MLGVSWFRLDALSVSGMSRMIVGLVKIDEPITANKGAVLGAKFAMQFAAICGLSTQVAVA